MGFVGKLWSLWRMRKFFNEQSDKGMREETDSEFSNLERKKKIS